MAAILPFGKHKGCEIDKVDPAYLNWMLRECTQLSPDLRKAIRVRLGLPDTEANTEIDKLKRQVSALKMEVSALKMDLVTEKRSAFEEGYKLGLATANRITELSLDRVKSWFRCLVKDYHPDLRKGSTEAMIAINDAYERIQRILVEQVR